jgi:integrase
LARVGSTRYQVQKILQQHNGIGSSKKNSRESSGLTGENGHAVSNQFHSYASIDSVRSTLYNLGQYARQEHGVKNMSHINVVIVKEWLKDRDVVYNSASNDLSELRKVSEHLGISKEDIKEIRTHAQQECRTSQKETRAYTKLDKVQIAERSSITYQLMERYGLRIAEASHINISKQLNGNTLTVSSKGGKIITKELSPSLVSKIMQNAQNGVLSQTYDTFSKDLNDAVENVGMKYNGTHGLRHSYAQRRLSEGAKLSEVSVEMGHTREEITLVYLR